MHSKRKTGIFNFYLQGNLAIIFRKPGNSSVGVGKKKKKKKESYLAKPNSSLLPSFSLFSNGCCTAVALEDNAILSCSPPSLCAAGHFDIFRFQPNPMLEDHMDVSRKSLLTSPLTLSLRRNTFH